MELSAAVLGMGAGVLLDPLFIAVWAIAGIFGRSLRNALIASAASSVAVRIVLFAIFAANGVDLPQSSIMLAMSVMTILVGLAVSALVYLAKRKAMGRSSDEMTPGD